MFEEFYTTKMSPEKKSLEERFSKILGRGSKISKIAIIATTSLLVVGAISVSVALAAFDASQQDSDGVKMPSEGVIATLKVVPSGNETTNDLPEQAIEKNYQVHDEEILTFSCPVAGDVKITAPYGENTHPITGTTTFHSGVDIEAQEGDDVYSPIEGVVTRADYDAKYGNCVVVENGKYAVLLAHLSSFEVSVGEKVESGNLVGKAGKTGQATGVNIHFEFLVDQVNANPERVLSTFISDKAE